MGSMAPKTCVVTGGAGFIGCALSSGLSRRFERVIVLDCLHPQIHPTPARPAALDPKPWRPDASQVEPVVRAFAENAAMRAGLRLAPEHMEELVAVAPWAIAMAKRLRRDHVRAAEVSSIFDPRR